MGVHSHSVTAAVDPAVVWERWTEVENWPVDDPDIVKVSIRSRGSHSIVPLGATDRAGGGQ